MALPHATDGPLAEKRLEHLDLFPTILLREPIRAVVSQNGHLALVTDRDIFFLDWEINRLRKALGLPVAKDHRPRRRPPKEPPWTGPLKFA
ncbi:MAG: hypothetical protein ACE149_15800 [Armatimonadota bacterium]